MSSREVEKGLDIRRAKAPNHKNSAEYTTDRPLNDAQTQNPKSPPKHTQGANMKEGKNNEEKGKEIEYEQRVAIEKAYE